MPDTIDRARTLIEERLNELNAEASELEAALRSLGGSSAPRVRRTARKPKSVQAGSRRRAPRGQRREQMIAAIKANPDAKVAELAKQIGISANQAHGLATALRKDGVLARGKALRLKGEPKSPKHQ